MATNPNKSALIKLTEERINTNEQLSSFVERASAATIPIFPETVQFTEPSLKFGAAIVSVDSKLDSYGNNKDIYKNSDGSYCLHLSKLNEIAQQSGLHITDSRVLERKTDEQGRVTYIEHQVKGKLRSVDGSIKEATITGKYDYFRDKEKYTSEKQVKGRRSHAEALAESNAITRLINKLIAKLPQSFTIDELKKPFLIPYVIEDKDALLAGLPVEDQLSIKKEVARKRLGLIDTIYQSGSPSSPTQDIQEAEVITETEEKKSMLSPEEQNHNAALTYKDAPQKERTEKILNLIKLKDFKDPNGGTFTATRIEKATPDDQVKFIEKLLNLPDPEEGLPV